MRAVDSRKPSLVTDAFRARVAGLLAPRGFELRAKGNLVRRQGKTWHRVEFSSSHRNVPGDVVCWVSFGFEDKKVEARRPGWAAGGSLGGHKFDPEFAMSNIAIPANADALAALVVTRLSFFELLERPEKTLFEVSRRYVPGFFEPSVVVPYLAAHLGSDAVAAYAHALLTGRQELWPAYASERESATDSPTNTEPDHGTQLARAMMADRVPVALHAPPDTASSVNPGVRSLRCFFGRQLRAWGEAQLATELRKLPDAQVRDLGVAQDELEGPLVENPAAVRLLLRAAVGQDRPPRRLKPEPRLYQYYQLHQPFA
jgi:hypothetical protein